MENYLNLVQKVLDEGHDDEYRNGTRRSIFGDQLEWDMKEGFPLVTTKKVQWRNPVAEMLWFIKGETDTQYLKTSVNIWKKWQLDDDALELDCMYSKGYIGPMYGHVWRRHINNSQEGILPLGYEYPNERLVAPDALDHLTDVFGDNKEDLRESVLNLQSKYIDQLWYLVNSLKEDPYSTRHVMSAFDPSYTPYRLISPQENILQGKGCLTPCHHHVQCHVTKTPEGDRDLLSLKFTMSSSDVMIGLPYNIAGYATLLHLLAREVHMTPHKLIYQGGDVHVYGNHIEDAKRQLERKPHHLPTMVISGSTNMFQIKEEDIEVVDYTSHPFIAYELS